MGQAGERGACGDEHGGAAGGVDSEQMDTETGGGADSASNSVGDVVEFEVEEDGVASLEDWLDDSGACGGEEFETNFEADTNAVERGNKVGGSGSVRNVESDDQLFAG
jgi:hypothetical protein